LQYTEDKGIYAFNFSEGKQDYKKIVNGKYSLLTDKYKQKILEFFKNHSLHHASVRSYLYPEKYHQQYAKDLNVNVSVIKQVHEVCSLPDLNQENLEIVKKVLTFETVNFL
jgi:hypothetical protein